MKNRTKLIFWQNIVSPHQSYFFDQISSEFEVILIVENLMSEVRKAQGWSIPEIENVEIIKIENKKHLNLLINQFKYEKNVFSGLVGMGYPSLKKASKEISKYTKIFVIAEAPMLLGYKKCLRLIKYNILYYKYKHKVAHIFAMGNLGEKFYSKLGFSNDMITVFQYFIKSEENFGHRSEREEPKKRYIFVGRLTYLKGIHNLINAFINIGKSQSWELVIVGSGVLESDLKLSLLKNKIKERVSFVGNRENIEVKEMIASSDFLILPTMFDGWGAVVSEALSVGTKVICNEKCGAAILVNKANGYVYKENKVSELEEALIRSFHEDDYDRNEIKNSFQIQSREKITEFISVVKSTSNNI
ncbi:glycosyltransferase [Chryseobacterium sp. 2TAF14]|uniref:glycosyltransferase n=1 Tax=Chryseobacterium sp. 2TAF14 TaxID=3233007 RepID=UPI003F8DFB97